MIYQCCYNPLMKLQFCIPVYQRNYTWNEKNCERLFDDIENLTNDKTRTHFIGSLVRAGHLSTPKFNWVGMGGLNGHAVGLGGVIYKKQ